MAVWFSVLSIEATTVQAVVEGFMEAVKGRSVRRDICYVAVTFDTIFASMWM